MSASATTVARWYEALDARDEEAAAEILAPGFRAHYGELDADAGLVRRLREDFRRAFPDLVTEASVLHACDDFAVARALTTGTHRGSFLGHAPTGRAFRATALEAFRLEGGRILELWAAFDTESMLRQLGLRGPA
jgi:hypothetical protein